MTTIARAICAMGLGGALFLFVIDPLAARSRARRQARWVRRQRQFRQSVQTTRRVE